MPHVIPTNGRAPIPLDIACRSKRDQGRVYLKAWSEVDKFSVVLREADEPGCDFMAFKVLNEEVLVQLEKDLVDYGVEVEQVPAEELKDCGRRVRFTVPSGHAFELFADKLYTGKWGLASVNPEAWPRGLRGMKAVRFDHCLFYGPELAATYDIFVNILGFDLAEQVLDPEGTRVAQFLTVSMKEHDVAFIHHEEKGKFHHASFYLESWEGVLRAADLIRKCCSRPHSGRTGVPAAPAPDPVRSGAR
ncbi:catechol 2,3 dioxygenase [Marinobacter salarius]|uniref:Catechol 2,3 dioxygenase n=1 Tax=Marinobacter salarius TaxID=1420917 RepID=W5YUQ4_9GAMM|nr:catechol 2,3 dioxygenase [Marinobacter salarius]